MGKEKRKTNVVETGRGLGRTGREAKWGKGGFRIGRGEGGR